MFDTYALLQTEIADELMRADLTEKIPNWIAMCEASVRRLLKNQNDIVRAFIAGGSASNRYEDLPGDFYELVDTPRVGNVTGSGKVEYVTPQVMDDLWANPESGGVPRFFTIVGGQMEFFPQPNGEQIELAYRQGVSALSDTVTSNALLLEAPDIYLYGSLIHSAPYLRDDDRLSMWKDLYNTAVADFNLAHLRKRFSGAPLVMRPRRAIG